MARFQSTAQHWRVLLATAAALLFMALLVPAFAQPNPPQELLLPNDEEAAENASAVAAWNIGEREAVEAALAALLAGGAAPEGVEARFSALNEPIAITARHQLYLPLQVAGFESGRPTPGPATPTPRPGIPADVAVTVWPKPSIWVARGAVLEYELRIKNHGKGDARSTTVQLPFNPAHMSVGYSGLDAKAGDYVSQVKRDSVTVTFGPLDAGKARSGKLFFRVNGSLAHATVLSMRSNYSWRDANVGGGQRGNWAPVLVGSGPADAQYAWVEVKPAMGPAGTQHRFFSDRFLPGETVTTWLNTARGVQALDLRGVANADGSVTLIYASKGLARGNYQMVLYGQRSGLTGVAAFVVE